MHQQMGQMQRSQHLKAVLACCIFLERKCPSSSYCFHARQDIEQFLGQRLHTISYFFPNLSQTLTVIPQASLESTHCFWLSYFLKS